MINESETVVRKIILEPIYLIPVEIIELSSNPVLDETGNVLRGEDGRIIYNG